MTTYLSVGNLGSLGTFLWLSLAFPHVLFLSKCTLLFRSSFLTPSFQLLRIRHWVSIVMKGGKSHNLHMTSLSHPNRLEGMFGGCWLCVTICRFQYEAVYLRLILNLQSLLVFLPNSFENYLTVHLCYKFFFLTHSYYLTKPCFKAFPIYPQSY